MQPPEIVEVAAVEEISCDGGQYYGHPKVYLTLGPEQYVDCYYCGRRFQLSDKGHEDGQSAA